MEPEANLLGIGSGLRRGSGRVGTHTFQLLIEWDMVGIGIGLRIRACEDYYQVEPDIRECRLQFPCKVLGKPWHRMLVGQSGNPQSAFRMRAISISLSAS
jgi:hypothetical protein